jgi:hypothetical protein
MCHPERSRRISPHFVPALSLGPRILDDGGLRRNLNLNTLASMKKNETVASFNRSQDALTEIDSFFRETGRVIIPFTAREIRDEQATRRAT